MWTLVQARAEQENRATGTETKTAYSAVLPRNYNHRPGSGSGFGKRCREAGEREEKRTVHEDVTESPGASTTILVKVAPGPIQALRGRASKLVNFLVLLYIWGGLLTERLESKQRKLAKQIETILRITNPQRHIHTNINIKSKHERPQTKACCEGRSGERSSTSNQ